jgi:O-antigen ligase
MTKQWFPYFDLGCALMAGAIWYIQPEGLPWTLPLSLGLAPWVVRWLLTGRPSRRTPYDWPLALFLISGGISVWAAYDAVVAWQKFWLIVGAVLIFYALANARALWPKEGPATADARLWGLTGLGLLISGYFMTTHDWTAVPSPIAAINQVGEALRQLLPTLPGHRLNPNVAGGLLAFMAPFAASLAFSAGWRAPKEAAIKAAAWLALLFILFGLVLTVSRGAWLALAGATGLFLLWRLAGWTAPYSLSRRVRDSRRARFRRQSLLFFASLALPLGLLLIALLAWPEALTALAGRVLPASLIDANRLALWRGGLLLARDYPFTGAGLGGFMMLYSTYALLIHVGHSFHAHNLFLNVALEQGTPALLFLFYCWLLAAKHGLTWLRGRAVGARVNGGQDSPVYAPALGAALLALVVILLHGLVDDAFYGSRSLLFFFVPLAFAMPRRSRPNRRQRRDVYQPTADLPRRYLPLALSALLILVLLLSVRGPLLAAWYANLGAVAQSQAELSVYSWPEWDLQDRVRQEVDLQPAVAHFQQALAQHPANGTANRRLGMIALARQEYPAALTYLEAAYAATPGDTATRQLLGEAYLVNGRVAEGRALWATVDNRQRQLEIRAYWYGQVGDPQRLAWIRAGMAGDGR